MDDPVSLGSWTLFPPYLWYVLPTDKSDRYYHSSSCAVRSGITCYHVSNKWTFPTSYLNAGKNTTNEIILSLPFNATDYESAVLPTSIYVQYDALRLEVK